MAKSSKKSRKGGIKVDFEGVESGGGRAVKDGVYQATVDKVEETESNEGNPLLKVEYKLKNGARLYDNISLLPQALWRFKTLLECVGLEVEDGEMEIDPDDLIGKELKVEVTNERWEGKDRPKVTGYDNAGEDESEEDGDGEKADDDAEDDDDEDEKKSSKKDKKKDKKKSKKDDDDEDDDDEDDEKDDDEDDDEEDDEDDKKSKKKSKDKKSKSKFKTGQKVTFKDEKGKTVKGVVTDVDGDTVKVEDKGGDEWEVDADEVEAA